MKKRCLFACLLFTLAVGDLAHAQHRCKGIHTKDLRFLADLCLQNEKFAGSQEVKCNCDILIEVYRPRKTDELPLSQAQKASLLSQLDFDNDPSLFRDYRNAYITNEPKFGLHMTCEDKVPSRIYQIKIHDMELKKIPDSIGNLSFLISADFSNNEIKELPESLQHTRRIRWLNLEGNHLRSISKGVFGLSNLQGLNINQNKLEALPWEIRSLVRMEVLLVKNNLIHFISEEIKALKRLRVLHLDYNQLENLPENIGGLDQLQILSINHNKLSEIPREIGEMNLLKKLYLEDNQLEFLPEELAYIRTLEEVAICRNGSVVIPPSFQKERWANWFFDQFPPSEAAIILPTDQIICNEKTNKTTFKNTMDLYLM